MLFRQNVPLPPAWRNRPKRKLLLAGLAYAAAVLCLAWVFRGVSLRSFIHQFDILKPGYVALAIVFSVAVYFANAWRWSILLRPLTKVSYRKVVQTVYIGLFFNEVLPLRPGEVIRCYLLSRWGRIALPSIFASAILERILDGLWMTIGFFAVASMIQLPRSLLSAALILAMVVTVIMIVWLALAFRGRNRTDRTTQHQAGTRVGISNALVLMGHPGVVLAAGVASCLPIACHILAMWFLMKGSGFDLPVSAAMAVLLIIRVGTVIPNAPGNIGSYQFFCVLAMGLFGIDKPAAAAFSLLTFGVFTVPLVIGGAIAVVSSGFNFEALRAANRVH